MKNNSKHLKIAGVLEIVLGVAAILAIRGGLSFGDFSGISEAAGEEMLFGLVGLYALYIFQIVAGLLGIVLSGKKSIVTVILGAILFLIQIVSFIQVKGNIMLIIFNALLLAIPYYYLHNAYKIYKNK